MDGFAKLKAADGALDPAFKPGFAISVGAPTRFALYGPYVYTDTTSYGTGVRVFPRLNTLTGQPSSVASGVGLATQQILSLAFSDTTGYASVSVFLPGIADPVSSVLKFDTATGAADTGFSVAPAQLPTPIFALATVGGSLYAAATPVLFGSDSYGYFLAKLNGATGAPDTAFSQPSATVNGAIRVLVTTGSDLWAGGDFNRYRGGRSNYFIPIDPQTGASADP